MLLPAVILKSPALLHTESAFRYDQWRRILFINVRILTSEFVSCSALGLILGQSPLTLRYPPKDIFRPYVPARLPVSFEILSRICRFAESPEPYSVELDVQLRVHYLMLHSFETDEEKLTAHFYQNRFSSPSQITSPSVPIGRDVRRN